jgi:predicted nuclease of predicted toxin-antitoxin system
VHSFYSNECFPRPVVIILRELGHNVLTTHEAGKSNRGIPDESVLGYAIKNKLAVLTCDRDKFIQLHSETVTEHYGIVVCTMDNDFQRFASQVHESINTKRTLMGELIRITKPSTQQRKP